MVKSHSEKPDYNRGANALLGLVATHAFLLSCIIVTAADSPFTTHPENTWLKQSPREGVAAPGFYYEGSGGFDPFSNQWIHHAGHDGIPQGFHTFTCDLASAIQFDTNASSFAESAHCPSRRVKP